MKRHNIKVYPLAIQAVLGDSSRQKAVVIILPLGDKLPHSCSIILE